MIGLGKIVVLQKLKREGLAVGMIPRWTGHSPKTAGRSAYASTVRGIPVAPASWKAFASESTAADSNGRMPRWPEAGVNDLLAFNCCREHMR